MNCAWCEGLMVPDREDLSAHGFLGPRRSDNTNSYNVKDLNKGRTRLRPVSLYEVTLHQ